MTFISLEKILALVYFGKGLSASGAGDVTKAERELLRALKLSESDIYRRALSQVYSAEANRLLSDPNIKEPSGADVEKLRKLLVSAVENAEQAARLNPQNYQNWLFLGNFYESLLPLGIEGSFENAKRTYEEARSRDPLNPSIDLGLARVELSTNTIEKAEQFIRASLEKKPNYSQALFLLSRIELFKGNLERAITLAKDVINLNLGEPTAYFYLGMLYYQNGSFLEASTAFRQALLLEPLYSNARYFLGLSFYEIDSAAEAIEQFEILSRDHPDQSEIKLILENLKAGREPLFEAEPPPEERTRLPLGE